MQDFVDLCHDVPTHACETASGSYVDVVNPDPETINLHDIAWSISRQARFAGHTLSEEIWTVSQHALFVEDLLGLALDEEGNGYILHESLNQWMDARGFGQELKDRNFRPGIVQREALHHDDTEAYLIDLPSPVKRVNGFREEYKRLEAGLKIAIAKKLGLPEVTKFEHELVNWADLLALRIEAANLMPSRGRGWTSNLPIMPLHVMHLMPTVVPWKKAFDEFMKMEKYLIDNLTRYEWNVAWTGNPLITAPQERH